MWISILKYSTAWLILLSCIHAHASGVFGVDTRKPGYGDSRYDAVVRLEGQVGYCSGVLIAPQYVLTAAHCKTVLSSARFEQSATSKIVDIKIDHTWVGLGWLTYNGSADPDDFAVAHLESPAPLWASPVELAKPSEVTVGMPATVLGYPADKSRGFERTLSSGCSIKRLVRSWLTSDCGIQNGNSGGPLFIEVRGVLKIAAVASMFVDCGREFCFAEKYSESNPNFFTNAAFNFSRIEAAILKPLPTANETL